MRKLIWQAFKIFICFCLIGINFACSNTIYSVDSSGAVLTNEIPEVVTDLDNDADGVAYFDGDCDDTDPSVFQGAVELEDNKDNNCNGFIDEGLGKTIDFYSDIVGCDKNNYQPWLPDYSILTGPEADLYFPNDVYEFYLARIDTKDNDDDGSTDETLVWELGKSWQLNKGAIPKYLILYTHGDSETYPPFVDELDYEGTNNYGNSIKFSATDPASEPFYFEWSQIDFPGYLTETFWLDYFDKIAVASVGLHFGVCNPGQVNEKIIITYTMSLDYNARTATFDSLIASYDDAYLKLINGWYYDTSYLHIFVKNASQEEGFQTFLQKMSPAQ